MSTFLLADVRPVQRARLVEVPSDSPSALHRRSVHDQAVHVAVDWVEPFLRAGLRAVPIAGLAPCAQWVAYRRTDRRGAVLALAESLAALAAAGGDDSRGVRHRADGNRVPG